MNFYSTNKKAELVSFKEAVYKSLPEDNGLYFPEFIPDLSDVPFKGLTLQEIGFEVMSPFVGDEIPKEKLLEITYGTLNFDIPLIKVEERIHSLELFHGPTYAFKDVGARLLARCLGYFNSKENTEVTILVATSGDTGGAVASGFYNVEGINVVILYPSGGVSELQEKQLTTLGGNIQALEIDGTFDDCQKLVKQAFLEKEIRSEKNISSANSINIARWIPQSIYYFWALNQIDSHSEAVFAVPSGNYGNLAAGLLAKKMGADIKRFIAASNANNVIPRYLESGQYEPRPTIKTFANAMDVGNPSNFPRILELYGNEYNHIVKEIQGGFMGDEHIIDSMRLCKDKHQYILDPHGAIGYNILKENLNNSEMGIFLETAHPCKFLPVMKKAIPDYEIPSFAMDLMEKEKKSQKMNADFKDFKDFLLN